MSKPMEILEKVALGFIFLLVAFIYIAVMVYPAILVVALFQTTFSGLINLIVLISLWAFFFKGFIQEGYHFAIERINKR